MIMFAFRITLAASSTNRITADQWGETELDIVRDSLFAAKRRPDDAAS